MTTTPEIADARLVAARRPAAGLDRGQPCDDPGSRRLFAPLRRARGADGRRLFELRDIAELLAVDERGERLLWFAPGSLTPNVLRVARLRPWLELDTN